VTLDAINNIVTIRRKPIQWGRCTHNSRKQTVQVTSTNLWFSPHFSYSFTNFDTQKCTRCSQKPCNCSGGGCRSPAVFENETYDSHLRKSLGSEIAGCIKRCRITVDSYKEERKKESERKKKATRGAELKKISRLTGTKCGKLRR